jgi:hypothetical protein
MASPSDADTEFLLEQPTRYAIAEACRSEARSIYGMAKALRSSDGAIRDTVKLLAERGILVSAPGNRGEKYRLRDDLRDSVARAVPRPHAQLDSNDHVLLISSRTIRDLNVNLDEALLRSVTWAARVHGERHRLLVAFADRDEAAADDLDRAISGTRLSAVRVKLGAILNREELAGYFNSER